MVPLRSFSRLSLAFTPKQNTKHTTSRFLHGKRRKSNTTIKKTTFSMSSTTTDTELALDALQLNEPRFLELLEKLIGESRFVQNTGVGTAFVPEEDRVVAHVLKCLDPFKVENGGKLIVERKTYVPGRSNVIIRLPGKGCRLSGRTWTSCRRIRRVGTWIRLN